MLSLRVCLGAQGAKPIPYGSKDSYFEAFRPKDNIIQGFWAILSHKDSEKLSFQLRCKARE